jgi:hypothetical protein
VEIKTQKPEVVDDVVVEDEEEVDVVEYVHVGSTPQPGCERISQARRKFPGHRCNNTASQPSKTNCKLCPRKAV